MKNLSRMHMHPNLSRMHMHPNLSRMHMHPNLSRMQMDPNLSRMHMHPNRMVAIRDSEVKQLFLNAKPRRLEFGGSKRPFLVFLI